MRRTFVLVSLAVTTLVTVAFAVPLALVVRADARSRALERAEREVVAVSSVIAVGPVPASVVDAIAGTPSGRAGRLAVHLPGGSRLDADGAASDRDGEPRWASADAVEEVRRNRRGVNLDVPGGVTHLHPNALPDGGTAVVEVFIPDAELHRGVTRAWLVIIVLGLVLLGASALLADRLAAGAVRAIRQLAVTAAKLGGGDLAARVQPDGPQEVATVGAAFNTLADRFGVLLANERELVADLSHRLRTPLTALRLNAEALPDTVDRQRVLDAAANVEREVDAIIEQARRPLVVPLRERSDLAAVVAERVEFWSALADDQHRSWAYVGADGPLPVPVPSSEVAAALDAVLGNVFRHTPPGTAARVRLVAGEQDATVVVDDAGPGIAAPVLAVRRGSSGTTSTGLGLDIARRVAHATGGGVEVGHGPLGGARITLRFRYADEP